MCEELVLGHQGQMLVQSHGSQPQLLLPHLWTEFGVSSHEEGVRLQTVLF